MENKNFWYTINESEMGLFWMVEIKCNSDCLVMKDDFYSKDQAEYWAKGFIDGINYLKSEQ
jgi:hypothetical protein